MQCLVVGYGSIGKRHAQTLKSLGAEVCVVTAQIISSYKRYDSILAATNNQRFDYVIIANATANHHSALLDLITSEYEGVVLIEKPLFSKVEHLPHHKISKILVAYNLRFHPLLVAAKKLLENEKIITFTAYVGQYLPTWRPNSDYRACYSAKKTGGGGVLRDLSHELDYSIWFCGPCEEVTAIGGHFSELEINTDDAYSIMMRCQNSPVVSLHLNYLDRSPRRDIHINTLNKTISIDLINGHLMIDGEIHAQCTNGGAQTYLQQHKALLDKNYSKFSQYDDGFNVLKIIEAIENSTTSKQWMTL